MQYQLIIFILEVTNFHNLPVARWKPIKIFNIQNRIKRFPFLKDEDELILKEIEEIVCGYKSETYALLHIHSDLALIKFLVDTILKYGIRNILFEYSEKDSTSLAIEERLIDDCNEQLDKEKK